MSERVSPSTHHHLPQQGQVGILFLSILSLSLSFYSFSFPSPPYPTTQPTSPTQRQEPKPNVKHSLPLRVLTCPCSLSTIITLLHPFFLAHSFLSFYLRQTALRQVHIPTRSRFFPLSSFCSPSFSSTLFLSFLLLSTKVEGLSINPS